MSIGILGKKLGMTRLFGENGEAIPATVIEAGPCPIVQIKSEKTDGYQAIQIGFVRKKENAMNKPALGHLKKAGVPPLGLLREFRIDDAGDYEVGGQITVDVFSVGELIDISGVSKGKGFAGVMKRWGHKGGRATHGSEGHRRPGSVGASADPSRVFRGFPMSGRMGGKRANVQNLEVIKVDTERNLLVVRGAVPGPKNGVLTIKRAVKG